MPAIPILSRDQFHHKHSNLDNILHVFISFSVSTSLLLPEYLISELELIDQRLDAIDPSDRQFLIDPRKLTTTREALSRDEALQEADWLFALLLSFYGGWRPLTETGVNWMAIRQRLYSKIHESAEMLSLSQWRKLLAETLGSIPDFHLGVVTTVMTSEGLNSEYDFFYRSGVPQAWTLPFEVYGEAQAMGLSPVFFCQLAEDQRIEPRTCVFASSPSSFADLGKSAKILEMPMATLRADTASNLPLIDRGKGWTYVRFGEFSWKGESNAELFSAAENTDVSDTVVVDLRGNTGGDEAVFGQWLELLGAESVRYEWGIETVSFASHLWELNLRLLGLATEFVQSKELPNYEQRLSGYSDAVDEFLQQVRKIPRHQEKPWDMGHTARPKDKKFRGRLIGLIDRQTLSAGESAARMIRQLKDSFLIGINTGGMRVVSCNARWLMPHSRLLFCCGRVWTTSVLADNRFREGCGLLPDLFWNIPNLKVNALVDRVLNFATTFNQVVKLNPQSS